MSAGQRYVAFLRAINVGGRNVKKDRLRAPFEALGFTEVDTFIASGNVIFRADGRPADALEAEIEARIAEAFGWESTTFVRTPAELAAIAAHRPFGEIEAGHTLSVAFLKAPPGRGMEEKVRAARTEMDDLHLHGREVYWLCRGRTMESKIWGGSLETALGLPATVRNVTTVRKLAEKYPPDER